MKSYCMLLKRKSKIFESIILMIYSKLFTKCSFFHSFNLSRIKETYDVKIKLQRRRGKLCKIITLPVIGWLLINNQVISCLLFILPKPWKICILFCGHRRLSLRQRKFVNELSFTVCMRQGQRDRIYTHIPCVV